MWFVLAGKSQFCVFGFKKIASNKFIEYYQSYGFYLTIKNLVSYVSSSVLPFISRGMMLKINMKIHTTLRYMDRKMGFITNYKFLSWTITM